MPVRGTGPCLSDKAKAEVALSRGLLTLCGDDFPPLILPQLNTGTYPRAGLQLPNPEGARLFPHLIATKVLKGKAGIWAGDGLSD